MAPATQISQQNSQTYEKASAAEANERATIRRVSRVNQARAQSLRKGGEVGVAATRATHAARLGKERGREEARPGRLRIYWPAVPSPGDPLAPCGAVQPGKAGRRPPESGKWCCTAWTLRKRCARAHERFLSTPLYFCLFTRLSYCSCLPIPIVCACSAD